MISNSENEFNFNEYLIDPQKIMGHMRICMREKYDSHESFLEAKPIAKKEAISYEDYIELMKPLSS